MIERIDFGRALRRGWRLLLLMAVVGAVVALLIPPGKPAKTPDGKFHWSSQATTGVEPSDGIGSAGVTAQTVLFWADNYYVRAEAVKVAGMGSQVTQLVPLMTAAQTTLGAKTSGKGSKSKTKTGAHSNIVALTAFQTTPALATKLANEFAVQVGDTVNKVWAEHAQGASAKSATSSGYTIIFPATNSAATRVTSKSSSLTSSKKVRLVGGIVLGILVGALLVLLRESTDRRLRTAHGAEAATRYPVLVEIPVQRPSAGQSPVLLAVAEEPRSSSAEGYRMLRMSVMFEELAAGQPPPDPYGFGPPAMEATTNGKYSVPESGSRQVVLVVSPAKEYSRPLVAANLGATYAESGQKAIVISTEDLDPGYPLLRAQEPTQPIGPDDVAGFLQTSSLPNVARLSFRHFVGTSGQLVTRAPEVLNAARQLADVIIVESPPFLESHHGEALVHAVDVVLMVVESRSTSIDEGKRTGNLLRRLGAPVLGVVFTHVEDARRSARPTEPEVPMPQPAPTPPMNPRVIPETTKS